MNYKVSSLLENQLDEAEIPALSLIYLLIRLAW
jgi:hypothetical protein